MTNPTKIKRIQDEFTRREQIGDDFSPKEFAATIGVTPKEATAFLKENTEKVYLKRKARASRSLSLYYPSVWGFVQEVPG